MTEDELEFFVTRYLEATHPEPKKTDKGDSKDE